MKRFLKFSICIYCFVLINVRNIKFFIHFIYLLLFKLHNINLIKYENIALNKLKHLWIKNDFIKRVNKINNNKIKYNFIIKIIKEILE